MPTVSPLTQDEYISEFGSDEDDPLESGLTVEDENYSSLVERHTGPDIYGSVAELVDRHVVVEGHPYNLARRRYLEPILNIGDVTSPGRQRIIIQSGRQVEKSSVLSAKSLVMALAIPNFKTLFVSPRYKQVTVFSQQRLMKMFNESKAIQESQFSRKNIWQVNERHFNNGSIFNFRSCYLSADGARGISANHLMIDEIQDVLQDNIRILEETLAHAENVYYTLDNGQLVEFPMSYQTYTGTPKTAANPITRLYEDQSTQFEWVVRCTHCRHHNIMGEDNLAPMNYKCSNKKCSKPINPPDGRWEAMAPDKWDDWWGFRLPQLMVPFMSPQKIWRKYQTYSRNTFHNEVLGLPYDEGSLVLTRAIMQRACDPDRPMAKIHAERVTTDKSTIDKSMERLPLRFSGLDHGSGEGEKPSYTVLVIGGPDSSGHRFHFHYLLRFTGRLTDQFIQPAIIDELCRKAGVTWMAADWGFGTVNNRRMVSEHDWSWTPDDANPTILEVQALQQYAKARWKKDASRYLIDRSTCMEEFIDAIRRGHVTFPRFEDMTSEDKMFGAFVPDFTNIVGEYDERQRRTRYLHPAGPDDAFHACMLAYLGWQQYEGKLVRSLTPNIPNDSVLDQMEPINPFNNKPDTRFRRDEFSPDEDDYGVY